MRSLKAVIILSRQQLLCWSSGKATPKRTARSLEAARSCFNQLSKRFAISSLTRSYSVRTVFQHSRKTFKQLSFKLGEFKQFKPKLGMQVSDQHGTKLLFSSKFCQRYIQSYQPAMEVKQFLADPAAFDQNRNNRKVKRSLSFGIVALLCKFPLVTLKELQLSLWGFHRFHKEQNTVRVELYYPWWK